MANRLRQQRLAKAAEEDPAAQYIDTRPDAASHVRAAPETIAPTPLNTRQNFGSPEELTQLGESMRVRQLQAVVVVPQADYLKIFPEHADDVRRADYVLVSGERRWRAARMTGLTVIEASVRPQLAASRADFIDAMVAENLYRQNLDPIEEAEAVEAMVRECGTAVAAAEKFKRHETWVSQRRALLKLAPHLQDLVRSGELPVRHARSIASLPKEDQEAAWLERLAAEEGRPASGGTENRQPADNRESPGQTGSAGDGPGPGGDRDDQDPPEAGSSSKRTRDPGPDDDGDGDGDNGTGLYRGKDPAGDGDAPDVVPWYSPVDLARVIRERLEPEAVNELVKILTSG